MNPTYHIYFQEKVLFKNLTLEEFTLIWNKLYTSYWKEEITYAECLDDVCVKEEPTDGAFLLMESEEEFRIGKVILQIAIYDLILHLILTKRELVRSTRYSYRINLSCLPNRVIKRSIDKVYKLQYDMNVITTHYGERIHSQSENPEEKNSFKTRMGLWFSKSIGKRKNNCILFTSRGVSYNFLKSFVTLAFDLVQAGAAIQISQDYSSMVNFARCKCLGANVFEDQIKYLGMVNSSMIINSGLTQILFSTQRSSIS